MTNHGINDWAIVEKYQLGYVSEPIKGDERFVGRLSIPYLTRNGPASLKFRRLEGESGRKYDQHHAQKPRMYNTNVYFTADDVIGICEGEIDAIAATEFLEIPTIGIPGSNGWVPELWTPVFKDFRQVIIFTDGDDAGNKMGETISKSLGFRARIVACDPGEDICSMVVAGRADTLCQLAKE